MSYYTYDYLPDLTPAQMRAAIALTYKPFTSTTPVPFESWATYATAEDNAILKSVFSFQGQAGATYSIISVSYFDPFILRAFDSAGNVIAIDDGTLGYGSDYTSFVAPYTGTYYVNASWDQGAAAVNKGVSIGVWQDLDTAPTNRPIKTLLGTAGNDVFFATAGDDIVMGLAGFDTLTFPGAKSAYTLTNGASSLTVTDKAAGGSVDTVSGIERLIFSDRVVSYEVKGAAPEVYRLYRAAFDRAPDEKGIGFWIGAIEKGATLREVATEFTKSDEFRGLFGENATNAQVLTGIYKNVLHRAPDMGGFAFWLNNLDSKAISTAQMLIEFSESAENQAQVIGSLTAGFEFVY